MGTLLGIKYGEAYAILPGIFFIAVIAGNLEIIEKNEPTRKGNFCLDQIDQLKKLLSRNDDWLEEIKGDPRKEIEFAFISQVQNFLVTEKSAEHLRDTGSHIFEVAKGCQEMVTKRKVMQASFNFLMSKGLLNGSLEWYFDRARSSI